MIIFLINVRGKYFACNLSKGKLFKSLKKSALLVLGIADCNINPEKPDVPLNKNDAFQKVQKRRVQEKR